MIVMKPKILEILPCQLIIKIFYLLQQTSHSFLWNYTSSPVKCYLLRLISPWAANALDSAMFLLWSASPVVVAVAMRVHEFGGWASEGALKGGVYFFGC